MVKLSLSPKGTAGPLYAIGVHHLPFFLARARKKGLQPPASSLQPDERERERERKNGEREDPLSFILLAGGWRPEAGG